MVSDPNLDSDTRVKVSGALGEIAKGGQRIPEKVIFGLAQMVSDPELQTTERIIAAEELSEIAKGGQRIPEKVILGLVELVYVPNFDSEVRESVNNALRNFSSENLESIVHDSDFFELVKYVCFLSHSALAIYSESITIADRRRKHPPFSIPDGVSSKNLAPILSEKKISDEEIVRYNSCSLS